VSHTGRRGAFAYNAKFPRNFNQARLEKLVADEPQQRSIAWSLRRIICS
jgi:hypothetical protein